MAFNLKHQTVAEFVTRLREQYRYARGTYCAQIATWLLNRIDAGDLTDAQASTAFGLTAGQWAALKAKMTVMRSNWQSTNSAAGE